MNRFERRDGQLYCEEVPLDDLARQFQTPLYVYSRATLARHYQVFKTAFEGQEHLVCFAVKANPSLAVLNLLASMGAGADIVSGGELFKALEAGIPPGRIVYSGVGKRQDEMEQALRAGIAMFNIESFQELNRLDQVAGQLGVKAPVALRLNLDVDPRTHPYLSTGIKESKFGIYFADAMAGYKQAGSLANVEVVGVDCHIGSQLVDLDPFVEAVGRLRDLIVALRDAGFGIRHLDMGGGLGITYDRENPPSPAEYGKAIRKELADLEVNLILEPGRNLVGNAGILLTRVLYTKQAVDKRFVITDAGMNDLIRPSLYGSYHAIEPVVQWKRPIRKVDVVGPICESGDFFATDREMVEVQPGELLAVMSAGAYGMSMASTYNSRPLPAEVLIDGSRIELIRERDTYRDLIRGERMVRFE